MAGPIETRSTGAIDAFGAVTVTRLFALSDVSNVAEFTGYLAPIDIPSVAFTCGNVDDTISATVRIVDAAGTTGYTDAQVLIPATANSAGGSTNAVQLTSNDTSRTDALWNTAQLEIVQTYTPNMKLDSGGILTIDPISCEFRYDRTPDYFVGSTAGLYRAETTEGEYVGAGDGHDLMAGQDSHYKLRVPIGVTTQRWTTTLCEPRLTLGVYDSAVTPLGSVPVPTALGNILTDDYIGTGLHLKGAPADTEKLGPTTGTFGGVIQHQVTPTDLPGFEIFQTLGVDENYYEFEWVIGIPSKAYLGYWFALGIEIDGVQQLTTPIVFKMVNDPLALEIDRGCVLTQMPAPLLTKDGAGLTITLSPFSEADAFDVTSVQPAVPPIVHPAVAEADTFAITEVQPGLLIAFDPFAETDLLDITQVAVQVPPIAPSPVFEADALDIVSVNTQVPPIAPSPVFEADAFDITEVFTGVAPISFDPVFEADALDVVSVNTQVPPIIHPTVSEADAFDITLVATVVPPILFDPVFEADAFDITQVFPGGLFLYPDPVFEADALDITSVSTQVPPIVHPAVSEPDTLDITSVSRLEPPVIAPAPVSEADTLDIASVLSGLLITLTGVTSVNAFDVQVSGSPIIAPPPIPSTSAVIAPTINFASYVVLVNPIASTSMVFAPIVTVGDIGNGNGISFVPGFFPGFTPGFMTEFTRIV